MKEQLISMPALSDEAIIDLYFARDEAAITATDRKYGRYLGKIAYNYLNSDEDSDECKNDTYLAAWKAIPPTRPDILRAFLARIITRIAMNRYKERTREKRIPSELTTGLEDLAEVLGSAESVEDAVIANELKSVLNNFVKSLSEKDRFIFVSRYYLGDSVPAIARNIGKSESLVKKQLGKAKERLKEILSEGGYLS